ncbi:polyketide synthase [Anaerolinea thermolimosa]|nr:type I polyketide synthase [Anaerolinea thermolimosa]GAP06224.1 polyketide synthase [Anaerolinea thermolimosa]
MPITKPVAVVGIGAVMPDANDAATFWSNIKQGRYSITEVPENRWSVDLYYDPDPTAQDKTYCKIGSWVRDFVFQPFQWGIAIPPRVLEQMDQAQQWAIAATRQALLDYGYPQRAVNQSRTAVIIGNALGGEKHYVTSLRIRAPEFLRALSSVPEFQTLPEALQKALLEGMREKIRKSTPEITEDTMPGELSNVIAGRVANVFNFQGTNFVTDAACASSLAALQAAIEGLNHHQFDLVVTGGVDSMMGVDGFVKFCKIGALSPDGSRPYADGANGFVMGEGAAIFLLKRLEDAERDGDKIYAVVRGIGSSSDGKGKGITAPNPNGQERAIERAWKNAGISPDTVGLIEGHGTSTRVGDLVEVESLVRIFGQFGLKPGSIALGSVKSNIGHLKSAAGAAGVFKVAMALYEKVLPPSINFEKPNPNIDFPHIPFAVNTQLRPWEVRNGQVRRAGVSSFGFGGTNFHVVMEEYVPGLTAGESRLFAGVDVKGREVEVPTPSSVASAYRDSSAISVKNYSEPPVSSSEIKPYRGLFFLSADTVPQLREVLSERIEQIKAGNVPSSALPALEEIQRPERLAIDYGDPAELLKRAERALKGFEADVNPWQALVAHGIFRGSGQPGKVAFLFPGQGSQYANMLKDLCEVEPIVAETFKEADRVMTPILGRPLTDFIYVSGDEAALAEAEKALRNTEITQPAMLTANVALLRLLKHFGFSPDMVIGHSLGEYAALVAAEVLTFAEALEVVSARGREMTKVTWEDNGCMAAVSAPIEKVEALLQTVDGYVVIANINSPTQCVIGGTTAAVDAALDAFMKAGFQGTKIPVSHAFHTRIVEPASEPLRQVISRMNIQSPRTTVIANVTGEVYPTSRDEILDLLAKQVASPVQFIKGMETLYRLGARVYVEVGPKRVLNALVSDILKGRTDVAILATNHPREGAVVSFNKALCGLLAAGICPQTKEKPLTIELSEGRQPVSGVNRDEIRQFVLRMVSEKTGYPEDMLDLELDLEADLGIDTVKQAELLAEIRSHFGIPRREDLRLSDYNTLAKVIAFIDEALKSQPAEEHVELTMLKGEQTEAVMPVSGDTPVETEEVSQQRTVRYSVSDGRLPLTGSVVISGAGLGLPGREKPVFTDDNIHHILRGEIRIEPLPENQRRHMLEKRVVRLIKSEAGAVMQMIDSLDQTIKLAGQRGKFDPVDDFGIPADRVEATDISTRLAIAAGIEALRDAGIPLVMRYRMTSKGTYLPDRWKLPEALADETGVIFASAFPGLDEMAREAGRYYTFRHLEDQITELEGILKLVPMEQTGLRATLEERIRTLKAQKDALDYHFDRRFIFRVLSMGHSQFAEYIGARGPNTHVNAACATTTHAIALAEDWIRTGRARRVIVIAGDDVTSGPLAGWVGTGLMASGAATTEGDPRKAILPFDRRRNGMVMGMGAAAVVVESEDAVRERGMRGICEVLATQIANSAFHGTRLDVQHVSEIMERLMTQAEQRFGLRRHEIAPRTVFVSHETYTPARGGSAAAEIHALRHVFGEQANQVVIANTKGFTGHTMGVGIEDVVAIKAIETGLVPPIANIQDGFEPDPELGDLRLSRGGHYDVEFALRLGAGFGSQIAMTLLRKIPGVGERIQRPIYQKWLAEVAGYETAELEVEKRTLRVRHDGPPVRPPARSNWQFGQGPTLWAIEHVDRVSFTQVVSGQKTDKPSPSIEVIGEVSQPQKPMTPLPEVSVQTSDEEIRAFVLRVVSEKTGYPVEMLDPELDLEADLGIDTVKQAELFAAIRTHFNLPRREDLRLADYNTLEKVIRFMKESLAGQRSALHAQEVERKPETPTGGVMVVEHAVQAGPHSEEIRDFVLKTVSEKTGYPIEMLDVDLDLEADLGIDTVKQAELFAAVRTHYNLPRREDLRLADYNTLAKVIQYMQEALGQTPKGRDITTPEKEKLEGGSSESSEEVFPETTSPVDDEAIKAFVLKAVSEKTGYPVEMLDLELDLEADLGIDTVKQAELFAAVREHYQLPRREDLRLADYNTLSKVIQFMRDSLMAQRALAGETQAASSQVGEVEATPETSANPLDYLLKQSVEQVIPRRVVVPVLRPRLDLCVSTGVVLDGSSRIVVVADQGKAAEALVRRLRSRKVQVLMIPGDCLSDSLTDVEAFASAGGVSGVYFLPALDIEPPLAEMNEEIWQAELGRRVLSLYALLRTIPGEPFLMSATRMGGLYGYSPEGSIAPLGGGVSGFTKALARERPHALVKVVDFEKEAKPGEIASRLLSETLNDPAVVEIGWKENQRYGFTLIEHPLDESELALSGDEVYVVSGGSGGIVAPVVLDLARNAGGRFYLLSRTPLPEPDDTEVRALRADREAFKLKKMQELKARGEKATPAVVDQKLAVLDRALATLDMIAAAEKSGATMRYLPCDVTDPVSCERAVQTIVAEAGKVDVFIHAAGVERSRKLESKPLEEFLQTLAVKASGFFHLFKAMEKHGCVPEKMVFFSSVAGRFGNTGQTDYSAANDLLAKLGASIRATYPHMQVVTIDWGAWAEVGMASRGYVPELMKRAGIEMMHPAVAAPLVRQEINHHTPGGEVIYAGSLGVLEEALKADGGLDLEKANQALTRGQPKHLMLTRVTGMNLEEGVILEAELDPNAEPFLRDHALNGIPLLPGVMGIEGLSAAAQHIASVLASEKGSYQVTRLENIQFRAPFKFYRNQPRKVTWKARVLREGDSLVGYASLESTLARYGRDPERMLHFTGKVYLQPTTEPLEAAKSQAPAWNGSRILPADEIYRLYFHGPAFRVLEAVQQKPGIVLGKLSQKLPPLTREEQSFILSPLLVELCLQTAGVWEIGAKGIMALPRSIGRLMIYPGEVNGDEIYAEVIPHSEGGERPRFDARVVDAKGRVLLELEDYRTEPLPYTVEKEQLMPLQIWLNNDPREG